MARRIAGRKRLCKRLVERVRRFDYIWLSLRVVPWSFLVISERAPPPPLRKGDAGYDEA